MRTQAVDPADILRSHLHHGASIVQHLHIVVLRVKGHGASLAQHSGPEDSHAIEVERELAIRLDGSIEQHQWLRVGEGREVDTSAVDVLLRDLDGLETILLHPKVVLPRVTGVLPPVHHVRGVGLDDVTDGLVADAIRNL